MKRLLLLSLFFSFTANGQLSNQDADGKSTFNLLGREWTPSFFSLASVETDKFNNEGGRLSTYNYLTMGSYVFYNYRFSVRLPFIYQSAGTDRFSGPREQEQKLELSDVMLGLRNNNLLFLPWDMGLFWEGRFYLPTGKHSKDSGLITRYRNHFILSRNFSRHFQAEYDQKYSYYIQSKTAYRVSFEDANGFPVETNALTKRVEWEHNFRPWLRLAPEVGIAWGFGFEDTYWNKSDAIGRSKSPEHIAKMGPAVRFPITKDANFIFSYEDRVDVEENRNELGRFRSENTQFLLLSFISL